MNIHIYRDSLPGNLCTNDEKRLTRSLERSRGVLIKWLTSVVRVDVHLGTCSCLIPGNTSLPRSLENPSAHTYLHCIASQGGGPFKPPALLLGHHEELG